MCVKTIVAKTKLDCENLLGKFLDESHFDNIIDYDCNFFAPPSCDATERMNCSGDECSSCDQGIDEKNAIFILRKNYFSEEEQLGALEGLKGAAGASQNRGVAAGPRGEKLQGREWVTQYQLDIIDYFLNPTKDVFGKSLIDEIEQNKTEQEEPSVRGYVWLTSKTKEDNFNFDEWVVETKTLTEQKQKQEALRVRKYISDTNYAAPVFSGVAGWFDRYPRIPYGRDTSYTATHRDKFELSYPLLKKLAKAFSEFLPKRFEIGRAHV